MDLSALYNGLKVLECCSTRCYHRLKLAIVDEVIERRRSKGGFWKHNEWTNEKEEVHLRFSSSAIRLLVDASVDGLVPQSEVMEPLKTHLAFGEYLSRDSYWFFHDSFESPSSECDFYRHRSVPNRHFGSSVRNQLVLNSHVDTLTTILHVLYWLDDLNEQEKRELGKYLEEGLNALSRVLESTGNLWEYLFSILDPWARRRHFSNYDHTRYKYRPVQTLDIAHPRKVLRRCGKRLRRMIPSEFYFAYARPHLKSKSGLLVHNDGFLDRDLCIRGKPAAYHIINIRDLSRLAHYLELQGMRPDLAEQLWSLSRAGLDYVFLSTYSDFLKDSFQYDGRGTQLCEAYYLRFIHAKTLRNLDLHRYTYVRRHVPPSPALLGSDTSILPKELLELDATIRRKIRVSNGVDILCIGPREILLVNYSDLPSRIQLPNEIALTDDVALENDTGHHREIVLRSATAIIVRLSRSPANVHSRHDK